MPYHKIARNLLETHCTQDFFDVDFYDLETSRKIAEELVKLGCTVDMDAHKSTMRVRCPESQGLEDA